MKVDNNRTNVNNKGMRTALKKTTNSFGQAIPIMAGILLLINLINPVLGIYYEKIFTGNFILDPLIGAAAGSVSFGIPIISYVVGGELLEKGISLLAVAAFMLAWSTVGVAMLPLEMKFLGKSFALYRNGVNFLFAIIIAILTIITISIF